MKVVVYGLPGCSKCEELKSALKAKKISFVEVDMISMDAQTELLSNGVYAMSAPVLNVEDTWYDTASLFPNDVLNKSEIDRLGRLATGDRKRSSYNGRVVVSTK